MFTSADRKHWRDLGRKELEEALSYQWNTNRAKNVIVFVGDGMSPDTITASRIYRAGETSHLAWEKFPHIGILKVPGAVPFYIQNLCGASLTRAISTPRRTT